MANVNNGEYGHIEFIDYDGRPTMRFTMTMTDGLWYHTLTVPIPPPISQPEQIRVEGIVRVLSHRGTYKIWHHRLGHPGRDIMENIHKYATGVPCLKHNNLWRCRSCLIGKHRKQATGKPKKQRAPDPKDAEANQHYEPGQGLHMDFGFARGSEWKEKTSKGKTITSMEGFNSYLIIVDKAT